ncbi:helix-turn-helix domain-containing protein [Pedobacter sp. LMG 31464]|uniref:Helix-turn-helix domain-containing protein n=1 Tax=Pedobacter planticolens TaxID=2679964 RepID=A0A923IW64_9SPHI|nr:helix-turn-helix transcriptional regulator [Pedobacter planticolens]MBB2146776.1 helix-turn-helix domain-containing protein [Pedobacter planticolens]
MLSLNLNTIFKARGIEKPYSYLVKAGINPRSANGLLASTPRALKLDHIEIICKLLLCTPNDLLIWTPTKDQTYPENHPLHALKKPEEQNNIHELLATMSFEQVKEITQTINNIKKAL